MAGRKLLKHELEEKVTELETELNSWKKKYTELNEQYELLDEQNTSLQTQVDLFERVESKLECIHNRINEFQRPTISGFLFTLLDNLLFNKPVVQLNSVNDEDEEEEEDEEDEEEENEDEDEEDNDIVIEPPTFSDT